MYITETVPDTQLKRWRKLFLHPEGPIGPLNPPLAMPMFDILQISSSLTTVGIHTLQTGWTVTLEMLPMRKIYRIHRKRKQLTV